MSNDIEHINSFDNVPIHSEVCNRCNGDGTVSVCDWWEWCPTCNGKGVLKYATCLHIKNYNDKTYKNYYNR